MVKGAPVPWMTVLVYSAPAAFSAGIVTFGAAPNFPVAVTALFEPAADPLDEEDEEPQPATAAAARIGRATSAAARRMKTSRGWP